MITQFRVQNYKALRDVTLNLTPIHLLIGPNDSGKTSLLQAMRALCASVDHPLNAAFAGVWEGPQLIWHGIRKNSITLFADFSGTTAHYELAVGLSESPDGKSKLVARRETISAPNYPSAIALREGGEKSALLDCASAARANVKDFGDMSKALDALTKVRNEIHPLLTGVDSYSLDPKFLALPVAAEPAHSINIGPNGFGLARCLDHLLGSERKRFNELESRFREFFPQIEAILLNPEKAFKAERGEFGTIAIRQAGPGKGIYFALKSGSFSVPAWQASDGILIVLTFLTISSLPNPPRLVLIEEPENGVHPTRLKQIIDILRDFAGDGSRTQVVVTSHSPYIVSLFEPEEVSLCRKNDAGEVEVRRLSESETVRRQSSVFALGEIWPAEEDTIFAETSAEPATAEAQP